MIQAFPQISQELPYVTPLRSHQRMASILKEIVSSLVGWRKLNVCISHLFCFHTPFLVPLSVWVYAIRGLFLNPHYLPWNTPPILQSHFNLNDGEPTISPPSLYGGTGRIRGKRMYMEDVDFYHTISPLGRSIAIYGVLDGHGGQECARFCPYFSFVTTNLT